MYDVVIIGGGIIGLATAYEVLEKYPSKKLIVVEKEPNVATHQTGNNSGVIHSGIYYKPGSLKAKNCRFGVKKLLQFCTKYGIKYNLCGKLIIANNENEIPSLIELYNRGLKNGVPDLKLLDRDKIRELEPHTIGKKGIHSPTTGIIDYQEVCNVCINIIEHNGGKIQVNTKIIDIIQNSDGGIVLETTQGDIQSKSVINCAGLYSDRIAKMTETSLDLKIIPFRGEYYKLKPNKTYLVKNLIYPVPNSEFPFLGVHFTRKINGIVEAGPNAVLAFSREGYSKTDINFTDMADIFGYPAFWKLGKRYWKIGTAEIFRSYLKGLALKELKKLIPKIEKNDLIPGGSGVRAQALSKNGKLLNDFHIIRDKNITHILNAPSPAATSAFATAEHIVTIFGS
jgi:L-2-hydroxyglutarate oxidase